jgi:Ca2+-binding EF-hand superfamily protein
LIKHHELAPKLAEVLSEIFDTFDKDQDGALNNQELSKFIFTTNGSHPPPQFLVQIAQKFGGTKRNWLTKEGFLVRYAALDGLVTIAYTDKLTPTQGFLLGANARRSLRDAE